MIDRKFIAKQCEALSDKDLKEEYVRLTGDREYADEMLDSSTTLADILAALCAAADSGLVYGDYDSEVREAAFGAISGYTALPYGFLYYLWLGDEGKAVASLIEKESHGSECL